VLGKYSEPSNEDCDDDFFFWWYFLRDKNNGDDFFSFLPYNDE